MSEGEVRGEMGADAEPVFKSEQDEQECMLLTWFITERARYPSSGSGKTPAAADNHEAQSRPSTDGSACAVLRSGKLRERAG